MPIFPEALMINSAALLSVGWSDLLDKVKGTEIRSKTGETNEPVD